jgi:hypothetical protein
MTTPGARDGSHLHDLRPRNATPKSKLASSAIVPVVRRRRFADFVKTGPLRFEFEVETVGWGKTSVGAATPAIDLRYWKKRARRVIWRGSLERARFAPR